MTTIIQENDITLQHIATILDESGWGTEIADERVIRLRTLNGLGFRVLIDSERQFLAINTHLPLRTDYQEGQEMANKLNQDVFLGCFWVDGDNDLGMSYVMSYERGLIRAQFMRVIRRFTNLLDWLVAEYGAQDDGQMIFDFERSRTPKPMPASATIQ